MKALRMVVVVGGIAAATLTMARPATAQDPIEKKTFSFPHVLETIGKAIDQPMPGGLGAEDQKAYLAQTEWLKSVRRRMEAISGTSEVTAPRDVATGQATGKRQHGSVVIVKEWGPLRSAIEEESRQFNTLSNASKVRHDIAMNAIRNIKA